MNKVLIIILVAILFTFLAACQSSPEVTEVTRIVTETTVEQVEVTRIVEGNPVTEVVEETRITEADEATRVIEVVEATRITEVEPPPSANEETAPDSEDPTDGNNDISDDTRQSFPATPTSTPANNGGGNEVVDNGPVEPEELRFSFGGGGDRAPHQYCWDAEANGKFFLTFDPGAIQNQSGQYEIGRLYAVACGFTPNDVTVSITTPDQITIPFSNLNTETDESGFNSSYPILFDAPVGAHTATFSSPTGDIVTQLVLLGGKETLLSNPYIIGSGRDRRIILLWDFEPFEMVRLFLYQGTSNEELTLVERQDVQVDANGNFEVNVGHLFPEGGNRTLAIRQTGEEIYDNLGGFWEHVVESESVMPTSSNAPTGLYVAQAEGGFIDLQWDFGNLSDPNVAGIEVHRSEEPDTPFSPIHLATEAASFRDTAVTPGATYYYRVRTVDTAGNLSAESIEVAAEVPGPAQENPPQTVVNCQAVSVDSDQSSNIEFINSSNRSVDIYWLDYAGLENLYVTLAPGESHIQQTYATHPWCIRDFTTGEPIMLVIGTAEAQSINIP